MSILAAVLLALSFYLHFINTNLSNFTLIFVYFFAGIGALIESIEDICEKRINIDVLMTLAAFLSVLIGSQLEGALLLVLFALSEAMEDVVTHKTKGALQSLHKLSPTMASVISPDGTLVEKSVKEISIGTRILIKSGEIIPLDGRVVEGRSHINMVHLTGESLPVSKHIDDEVQAGSMNMDGALTVEVTLPAANSTLARIIKLITRAQEAKPKLQRFLDKFGQVYATTIILLALFFSLALPFALGIPFTGWEGSIYRALAFLIAASPCALIIATPTAYLSAISACARRGILMKGGVTLDALSRCKSVAFDKTGTLTTGELTATSIEPITPSDITEEQAISIAASIERNSTHPIARAILAKQTEASLPLLPTEEIQTVAGYGLQGTVNFNGKPLQVAIGSADFMAQKGAPPIDSSHHKADHLITFMLVDSALYVLHFLDSIRPKMGPAIAELHDKLDLNTIMLTGDHQGNADHVAKALGIQKHHAELKPEEKLDIIERLSKEHHLAMVGDGINDAPALARATVGISMGEVGSATAIEASDIVFLKDDLTSLGWLMSRARKTQRIVRENLTLALGVIVLATTPALLGLVPLWMAVVLHEGGTILVALNSLRLLGGRH